jgi:hypothetical protein
MIYSGGGSWYQPGIQACLRSLQHMQRLQELKLHMCDCDPSVLCHITSLRKLHLASCVLLPGKRPGTSAFLSALQGLTQLQDIHLSAAYRRFYDAQGVPLQLFAALTAPTQLTSLVINFEDALPLAPGAVGYMFPGGRSMPQLQVLHIRHRIYKDGDMHDWCVGGQEIGNITSACPGLQQLELVGVVRPGASFSGLQQLTDSLSSLSVGGVAFDDAAAAEVAGLKQLQSLSVEHTPEFTAEGLECLTALTGLTRLHYRGDLWGHGDAVFRGRHIPVLRKRDVLLSVDEVGWLGTCTQNMHPMQQCRAGQHLCAVCHCTFLSESPRFSFFPWWQSGPSG